VRSPQIRPSGTHSAFISATIPPITPKARLSPQKVHKKTGNFMEQKQADQISASSFLPFYELEPRFERSLKLIELMESICANTEPSIPLATILRSTLESFNPSSAFLLEPHVGSGGEKWAVSAYADSLGKKQDLGLDLETTHPLINVINSGNICITRTNGHGFEFDIARNQYADSMEDGQFNDSQQLLVIPLMENLVARSALVLILENRIASDSQDLELLSAVQAIFSFFHFKNQNEMATNFETASQQFAYEVFNGLSETQLRIGHLIFLEKTDKEIMELLNISQSEFDKDYRTLLNFLMVTTREEIAAELSVLDFK